MTSKWSNQSQNWTCVSFKSRLNIRLQSDSFLSSFTGVFYDDICCWRDVADLTVAVLQPVRVHYALLFGDLSGVYEPQESAAVSNWQSRGKTMAQTILVEYLIEYHSSGLIKLDGGGQQSEQWAQILLFFLWFTTIGSLVHQKINTNPPLKQSFCEFLSNSTKIKV